MILSDKNPNTIELSIRYDLIYKMTMNEQGIPYSLLLGL
jgi:hypothetical protein